MSILDKTKIGNLVQINIDLSKDRLTSETLDALKVSSMGKISDFKILKLGEGIEVAENDFAAEVAATANIN